MWVLAIFDFFKIFNLLIWGSGLLAGVVALMVFGLGWLLYRWWFGTDKGIYKVGVLAILVALLPLGMFFLGAEGILGVVLEGVTHWWLRFSPEPSPIPFVWVVTLVNLPGVLLVIVLLWMKDRIDRKMAWLKLMTMGILMAGVGFFSFWVMMFGSMYELEECNVSMGLFHEFNAHLKDVCRVEKVGECPGDVASLRGFNPEKFDKMIRCGKVSYWRDEDRGLYGLSVRRLASPVVLLGYPALEEGYDAYTLSPLDVEWDLKPWPPDLPGEW